MQKVTALTLALSQRERGLFQKPSGLLPGRSASKRSRVGLPVRAFFAILVALAALVPAWAVAAPPPGVLDVGEIVRSWTPFGSFGDWAVFHSPTETDRKPPLGTAQGPPLAVALIGSPLPALGAFVECRPWLCGTSLQLGVLLGHDVYRWYVRSGHLASEQRTRVLLEPDAGFSHESDAVITVAEEGYPLQISMLLSVLLPDGRLFYRAMQESSTLVPPDALGEIRRSNVLHVHVRHSDGTPRTHEISLWGFSNALDVLELKCRHAAGTIAVRTRQTCRGVLETDGQR